MSHEDRILSLSPAAHSPVFIGGQHRSGTTLMRRLLMRHPHIASGPESNLFRDAESARGWCRRIGCGLSWRDHPDRYREVRYEELVTQAEAVMRSLLTFLGEPWSPGVLEGEAIFSTSAGRWRVDLAAAEIGEIEALAGEVMFDLGYALSTAVRESMRVQTC